MQNNGNVILNGYEALEKLGGVGYLATPFSHPDPEIEAQRAEVATNLAGILVAYGIPVISPIVYGYQLYTALPEIKGDYQFWETLNANLLHMSRYLLIAALKGYETSGGMKVEFQTAIKWKKPIFILEMQEATPGFNIIKYHHVDAAKHIHTPRKILFDGKGRILKL